MMRINLYVMDFSGLTVFNPKTYQNLSRALSSFSHPIWSVISIVRSSVVNVPRAGVEGFWVRALIGAKDFLTKGENPFMPMRSICVTYVACKYVTFSTFNALNIFAVSQRRRQVNLII